MPAAGGGADPGGRVDQFAADGGGGRLGQRRAGGERGRGAGEVEGHHGADQPGGVGGEDPRGQVRQRGGLEVGVDAFDDRVPAVGLAGGHRVAVRGRGGGAEGVGPAGGAAGG